MVDCVCGPAGVWLQQLAVALWCVSECSTARHSTWSAAAALVVCTGWLLICLHAPCACLCAACAATSSVSRFQLRSHLVSPSPPLPPGLARLIWLIGLLCTRWLLTGFFTQKGGTPRTANRNTPKTNTKQHTRTHTHHAKDSSVSGRDCSSRVASTCHPDQHPTTQHRRVSKPHKSPLLPEMLVCSKRLVRRARRWQRRQQQHSRSQACQGLRAGDIQGVEHVQDQAAAAAAASSAADRCWKLWLQHQERHPAGSGTCSCSPANDGWRRCQADRGAQPTPATLYVARTTR